tara:strand:- start:691 stop:1011 length:321 start_codon:yes stop_codon:yes gene_type:complete
MLATKLKPGALVQVRDGYTGIRRHPPKYAAYETETNVLSIVKNSSLVYIMNRLQSAVVIDNSIIYYGNKKIKHRNRGTKTRHMFLIGDEVLTLSNHDCRYLELVEK